MLKQLKSNISKIRTWGIAGIVNYLRSYTQVTSIKKFLRDNARHHPYNKPLQGITIIGWISHGGSAGKVLRDLAYALKVSGIPFQTFDTGEASRIPPSDLEGILTPRDDFRLMKYSHVIEILPTVLPKDFPRHHARIAFWEFESGFLEAYPDMPLSPHVIAMSDFNAQYFRTALSNTTKVTKILYPFHQDKRPICPPAEIRARYGIGNGFVVFYNFDFAGAFNRKNPDGAMRAFAKAFQGIDDARLVLKTKSSKSNPERLSQLMALSEQLGISRQMITINDYIPQTDIYGLANACDVYLSLHRGEGFGITLAEAMFLGKPVICTDWSATREFCKPDCTIPVPYKLVKVRHDQVDHPYYAHVTEWAEPDIDAAAKALKELYSSPERRIELGRKAAAFIRDYFSTENFRHSIASYMQASEGSHA